VTDTDNSPQPAPTPPGPTCAACGGRALVNWQRRLTDTELAAHQAAEQERRDQLVQLADPQQPAPVFGPLPQAEDCTRIVHACGPHAITRDAAALVHQKTCTAPNPEHLPECDCTPEQLPTVAAAENEPGPELPDHWIAP
jgi:hypothetical protein